ncbi:hypothetical protein AWJ20_4540 [Sugiyamaella lignohabitans]|uniref:Uncharacterized protein n=1 Tax=Sugiyamaella lignohabitans TaxID=796027 RepID=A0A167CHS9_9ASCO|nr:uncharacterized protein AWJ20_4540 [Sugiyamaella lignohabitans]ANB11719.1 hypothetical protein AWJ20_4540 [Sugiyamaella lignohabitans]
MVVQDKLLSTPTKPRLPGEVTSTTPSGSNTSNSASANAATYTTTNTAGTAASAGGSSSSSSATSGTSTSTSALTNTNNNPSLLLPPPFSSVTKTPRISPPKTPPPKHRNPQSLNSDRDGADLLMYLATSPSPAQRNNSNRFLGQYPSSSPFNYSQNNHPHTPQQGFELKDWLNIASPSPAQAQRTPDRPLLRSARQPLNFDHLPDAPSTAASAASRFSSHLSSSDDASRMVA